MSLIRWRWPVLAGLITFIGYMSQYYTVGGTLHLEPRQGPVHNPLAVFQGNASPATSANSPTSSADGSSTWQDNLTLGERLAVWAEKKAGHSQSSARELTIPSGQPPTTSPIPVPSGFAATANLAATTPEANPDSEQIQSSTAFVASEPIDSVRVGHGATDLFASPDKGDTQTIRVASFNTGGLGAAKLAKSRVLEVLVRLIRQYDVVTLQEIRSNRDDILPRLIDALNQSGRAYDYVIGPRVGHHNSTSQFAMVFDTDTVETDRYQLYTVDDPDNLLTYDPLVGWFRCKNVPEDQALTFSLVCLQLDGISSGGAGSAELQVLPTLIQAIQNDGRGEDDWILAGGTAGSVSNLHFLEQAAVRFAIRDVPTDVNGTKALDSIFFSSQATSEFTGRSGVYDFLRQFNLSIEESLEISSHLPVWAEFSTREGSHPGRVAPLGTQSVY